MNLLYRAWNAWDRFDPIQWLHTWTRNKLDERLLRERKTATICTWCNKNMQGGDGCQSEEFEHDEQMDVMECGECGGTSLWVWGFGFQYICHLDPPEPQFEPIKGSEHLRDLYFGTNQDQQGTVHAVASSEADIGFTPIVVVDRDGNLHWSEGQELEQKARSPENA